MWRTVAFRIEWQNVFVSVVQRFLRGVGFDLAIGGSVNQICLELLQDTLTPDEDEMAEGNNADPPFLVIHLGPTEIQKITPVLQSAATSFVAGLSQPGRIGAVTGRLIESPIFRGKIRESTR